MLFKKWISMDNNTLIINLLILSILLHSNVCNARGVTVDPNDFWW